ncbi:hypothetical protein SAMN05443429_11219 [Cruoricaptor ignavus]|uniref:Uncharacterized protein n=1 Tax=Cruoricaptor ignavus TaxID=1118202 RepID=A0A1M6HD78_9FLAO|nr:hypothetical protein [Cruoricaptor ignavus]SHJ20079.1 hypothetical protein SAMN05443429_11219 [Cruoricaptor ignavus]
MAEQKKDLTNPKDFINWTFYGLTATIATVSVTAYVDMRRQRDEAVDRVNELTDKVWEMRTENKALRHENEEQQLLIERADSTLTKAEQIAKPKIK